MDPEEKENLGETDDNLEEIEGGSETDSPENLKNSEKEEKDGKLDQKDEPPKKLSVRESIKDAFAKASDKEDTGDQKPDKEKPTDQPVDKSKLVVADSKPPPGWTKEAKSKWNTLPPDIRDSVLKREKEVSDGFAKYSDDNKKYKELEDVLAPRREAIKRFGASEAQIVNNLFQWMEGLTGPNKHNIYLQLGQNFGIDVSKLVQQDNKPDTTTQTDDDKDIPPAFKEFMQTVGGELKEVKSTLQAQKEEAAGKFITNWSKDKPHFLKVRQVMFSLLQSGVIPLKDGELDLDEAYNRATRSDPVISAQMDQERREKEEVERKVEAAKKEKDRLAKLAAARKAGSGVRSSAPMAPTTSKANANSKTMSVGESIRAAIAEHQDAS